MNLSGPIILQRLFTLFFTLFIGLSSFAKPFDTIPFRLVGEHIFIDVLTESSDTLNFVFDTGASSMVINEDIVNKYGWKFNRTTTSTGVSGSAVFALGKVDELNIGKTKFKQIQGVSAPLSHLELRIGADIDGIIGYEVLKQFIVSIDYSKKELRFFRDSKGDVKISGNPIEIGLELGIPSIHASISLPNGEKISGRFFIDSGAGSALILNSPLVKKHNIESKVPFGYLDQSKGLSNAASPIMETVLPELTFSGNSVKEIPTRLSRSRNGVTGMADYAGIIGNPILKRFTLIFDYNNRKMYVSKNEGFDKPFSQNTSGLKIRLDAHKSKIIVDTVIEGSPAEEAGIHALDELIQVNGNSFAIEDLHDIRDLLSEEDKDVKLEFIRGESTYRTQLHLKSWFK